MENGGFFPGAQSWEVYYMHIYVNTQIRLHLRLILHPPVYINVHIDTLNSNLIQKVFASYLLFPFSDSETLGFYYP